MGLLDSVLGQVLGGGALQQGQHTPSSAQMGGIDMGALTGMLGGLLANNGQQGGLGGLIEQFNRAGAGDAIGSWIGGGANQPVEPDQVENALGRDTIAGMASKLGINASMLLPILAALLPTIIDKLTPHGQAPAGGLGNQDDLIGQLGSLLRKG